MKSALLIFAFCLIGIEARSLVEVPTDSDLLLIELQNVTASFGMEVTASINVYGLDKMVFDGPKPFKMPINDTRLFSSGYFYQKISTPPMKSAQTVAFPHTFNFVNDEVPDESYLAIQFWNESTNSKFYLGGVKLTFGHLRSLGHSVKMDLSDENGENAGSIQFDWHVYFYPSNPIQS